MSVGLTISFLGVERSAPLDARMRELGGRLCRHHDRIRHCHITISKADDARYWVKLHLSVPGAQVHAEGETPLHSGICAAAATAFESARKQLSELQRDGWQYSLSNVVRRLGSKLQ